jgi:hypothetical protein
MSKTPSERGSPAAAGASASLRIIGGGRWNVAEVDNREVTDVDTKLHGRRTEKDGQLPASEFHLTLVA